MNEITKNLVCVVIRNGVQIWIENDKAETLKNLLNRKDKPQFVEFENDYINTNDISGIFSALSMEEVNRRKNGQWKCERNSWHDRGEKCNPFISNCYAATDDLCIKCGKKPVSYTTNSKGIKCVSC